MEELLYYVWQHKLFSLTALETDNKLPVEIIDTGLRNTNAGPDFFNAKVKIGDTLWVGNVEMHHRSSDWYRHGHDKNTVYDTVVLHVVDECDCIVKRSTGENIPHLILPYSDSIRDRYKRLSQEEFRPQCFSSILNLDKITIHSWLSALQVERLEVKQKRIQVLFDSLLYNWHDILFITIARNFGFGLNGDTFERWARKLPFRALDKHRDSLFQIEAIFFGLAGLLNTDSTDPYLGKLQEEYYYLKTKFSFDVVDYPWKLSKIRPGSFPHVRLAQLAWLYSRSEDLGNKLLMSQTLDDLYSLLRLETSEYWDTHFIFNKTSPKRVKSLGKKSLDLLIINTVVPFLYAYGKHKNDYEMMDKSLSLLSLVKPENNYITRLWENANINAESAADSQALIQLQKEYCDKKKCLYCRFGYIHLAKS